jgi:hypothetical protein
LNDSADGPADRQRQDRLMEMSAAEQFYWAEQERIRRHNDAVLAERQRQKAMFTAREQAAQAVQAEAAVCDHEPRHAAGLERCQVVAVGRCHRCGHAFCESHRGDDYSTLCSRCRDDIAAEEAHRQAAEKLEQTRAAAAAAKLAQEQTERHAAAVAAREAETGWAEKAIEVDEIDAWLADGSDGKPVSMGTAVSAAVLGVVAVALMVPAARAEKLGCVVALLGGIAAWALWTVGRRYRQHQRARWRLERDRLMQARGCGAPGCSRCAVR